MNKMIASTLNVFDKKGRETLFQRILEPVFELKRFLRLDTKILTRKITLKIQKLRRAKYAPAVSGSGGPKKEVKILIIACLEPEYLEYSIGNVASQVDSKNIFVLNNGRDENKAKIAEWAKKFGVNHLEPPNTHGKTTNIIWAIKEIAQKYPNCILIKFDEDVLWPNIDLNIPEFDENSVYIPNLTINNYTTRFYLENFKDNPPWIKDLIQNWDKYEGWVWHRAKENLKLADFIYSKKIEDFKNAIREAKKPISIIDYKNHEWPLMKSNGISSTAIAIHTDTIHKLFKGLNGIEEIVIARLVKHKMLRWVVNWNDFAIHINYYVVRPWVKLNYEDKVRPFIASFENQKKVPEHM